MENVPAIGLYPMTPGVVEWLSETFWCIDEGMFNHFRSLEPLFRLAQAMEVGETNQFVVDAAITRFNRQHNKAVTVADLLNPDGSYVFSDIGEWVVYTDQPKDIIRGSYNRIDYALYGAAASVRWAALWNPSDNVLAVHRSHIVADRSGLTAAEFPSEFPTADGLQKGNLPTFALPPQMEGVIRQETGFIKAGTSC